MSELNFGRMLARAPLYGDRLAVHDLGTGHSSTYVEHIDRVGHLCAVMKGLGLRPDDRVGVLCDASHVYIELWRACLAGAGIITPLNTRLADEEMVYILNDADPRVLFVDETYAQAIADLRARLPALGMVVLIGDDGPCDARLADLLATTPPAALPPEPAEDAAAALLYTGGTTGLPKGVVLSQRAITLTLFRVQMAGRYRPESRFLSFMPMFHIGSIAGWGLLAPTGGATIILPVFDPGAALTAIRDHGITFLGAVPTMLAMMLAHPEYEPGMMSSLEFVIYGAAPMPPALLSRLLDEYPDLAFFQSYGMTESAAVVTALLPEDHRRGGELLASVGRPHIGVQVDLRDPETALPTEPGDVGEIWIRSDSVLTEYWNRPELTATSLVDGWYRTGDAGRLDDDGFLFIADRVKDMIITGGENVYSIAVENAIASHPAVQQVAVVGVPDATWGEVVHAFVVCEPGSVTTAELAEHARASIAGFKVPKQWTLQADLLPMSAAGKVLKHQLRDAVADHEDGTGE